MKIIFSKIALPILFRNKRYCCAFFFSLISISFQAQIFQSNNPSLYISEGTIIIDTIHDMNKITIKYRNGKTEVISVDQIEENMMYEVREFIKLINNNTLESKINSHENSLNTSKIMEEIRKQIGLIYPADLK